METGRVLIGVKIFSQTCFTQYLVLSILKEAEDSLSKTPSALIESLTNLTDLNLFLFLNNISVFFLFILYVILKISFVSDSLFKSIETVIFRRL